MSSECERAARSSRPPMWRRGTWFAARTALIARSIDTSLRVRAAWARGAAKKQAHTNARTHQVVATLCSREVLPRLLFALSRAADLLRPIGQRQLPTAVARHDAGTASCASESCQRALWARPIPT